MGGRWVDGRTDGLVDEWTEEGMLMPMVKILKLSVRNLFSMFLCLRLFWPDIHFSTVHPEIR